MLLDNKGQGNVLSELKKSINGNCKLSILTCSLTVFGFASLRRELSQTDQNRLILSNWTNGSPVDLIGGNAEQPKKASLDQKWLATKCAEWLKSKTEVRADDALTAPMQNLYCVESTDSVAIHGSSTLTASGLGAVKSSAYEMNTLVKENDAKQLVSWFDTVWNDQQALRDVKEELLKSLEFIASEKPAQLVYFITLYNIFKGTIDEIDEEKIVRSKTGFQDTTIWNKLYKFQKDGVLGAIDKLERHNGCIIADSVGLGKTFEALAVIKYYELRNDRVLVLVPKRLRENWTIYTVNDKRNQLEGDRFSYDVINHTDLSRTTGYSDQINLETLNWGNYDLIVIDESHNFRNNGTKRDAITRYQRLMDQIIRAGVKTKVLMLSATPVSNRMNDLKNQVAFITEGNDQALSDSGISSLDNALRLAQRHFNRWLKLPPEGRKTDSLLESLNFEYFKLLDLLTIARSRKHIEKYYDTSEVGKFPERLKPMNLKPDIDASGVFPPLKDINRTINRLNLAIYAPLEYVRNDKKAEYSLKYDQEVSGGQSILKQTDRERNLINLMRVMMLKRMESSIHSFALTIKKFHDLIDSTLTKIATLEDGEFEELSIEEIETDSPEFEDFLIGNKIRVLIKDLDLIRWKQELSEDRDQLAELFRQADNVSAHEDAKLAELKRVIESKIQTPINSGNKKLIIFTAFVDTANYLYENLQQWARDIGLHSALVTGSQGCKSTLQGVQKDLNSILTNFSPISKERTKVDPQASQEIDILIATDCISEGQNLQDCDLLINYDIHWNPVRIIQRFGRIDRLNSTNERIQLANFWPNMELDEYIDLEARVSGRMVLLDISATGEENVIAHDQQRQMNDLEYRRKQMQQLQDSVIDLEDMDGSVSITDLTLNDLRMDLLSYKKDNLQLLRKVPTGYYASVQPEIPEAVAGTIFCLRDIHGKIESHDNYALAPYFIVYISEAGEVVFNHLQAKRSLDIMKRLGATKTLPDAQAVAAVDAETKNGRDMSKYRALLDAAIESIAGKSEEKGVESLFFPGGTVTTRNDVQGADDLEVVSFFIVAKVL
ncbi:MAG: helicase-related protein [Aestuariivita sp.]|nr:helicase-related protein [Aestuariivita sp.]MCY4202260.1 helicase-related protein [Aestuariivita sp.]